MALEVRGRRKEGRERFWGITGLCLYMFLFVFVFVFVFVYVYLSVSYRMICIAAADQHVLRLFRIIHIIYMCVCVK